MAMPMPQVSNHACIYTNQPEPQINADHNNTESPYPIRENHVHHLDSLLSNNPSNKDPDDTKYVGDECVFLLMPDGQVSCVAGIENLVLDSAFAQEDDDAIQYSRLECFSCHQVLEYDNRAAFIQCSSCNTLNAAPQGQSITPETNTQTPNVAQGGRVMIVICGRCNTRNISRLGSIYVECWLCSAVCQVDYPVERNVTVSSRRQRMYTYVSQRISTRLSVSNRSGMAEGSNTTTDNTTDNTTQAITSDGNSHRENSNIRFRVKVRLKERMRRVIRRTA